MRTETRIIDFSEMATRSKESALLLRLMMAANDIAIANRGLEMFDELPRLQAHVRRGARLYFVRLQLGHLSEALKLIGSIERMPSLRRQVSGAGRLAKTDYERLLRCLRGGPDNPRFRQVVKAVRDKTVFHYDGRQVGRALRDRASREDGRISKITRGDNMRLWRLEVADDIVDTIVCRQLWRIPRSADLRKEADANAMFGHEIAVAFLNFAGDFAFHCLRRAR